MYVIRFRERFAKPSAAAVPRRVQTLVCVMPHLEIKLHLYMYNVYNRVYMSYGVCVYTLLAYSSPKYRRHVPYTAYTRRVRSVCGDNETSSFVLHAKGCVRQTFNDLLKVTRYMPTHNIKCIYAAAHNVQQKDHNRVL